MAAIVAGGGDTGSESDRQEGLSLPESFGVDAVEAGIRGLAHTAGEPVVVVLVAASGTFFAIISLASAGKKERDDGVDHNDRQCEFTRPLRPF